MGKMSFEIPDELTKQFSQMANLDDIAPKMLIKAAPIVEKTLKNEMSGHVDTGSMRSSVEIAKPKKYRASVGGAHFIVIRPTGTNKKGIRNMEVLMHLEYGYQRRLAAGGTYTVKPLNIVAKAVAKSQNAVNKALQEAFDEEVNP